MTVIEAAEIIGWVGLTGAVAMFIYLLATRRRDKRRTKKRWQTRRGW